MTNEEVVQAYKEELERLYGEAYANATVLEIGKAGWFYLSFPHQAPDGTYKVSHFPTPVRKKEILEQIEEMRATRE